MESEKRKLYFIPNLLSELKTINPASWGCLKYPFRDKIFIEIQINS